MQNRSPFLLPAAGLRVAVAIIAAATLLLKNAHAENWPQWRGPLGTGITSETQLPLRWGPEQGVRWKAKLPERGNSTPIVWNDRVFLTQAIGKERMLLCINRADGTLLWQSGTTSTVQETFHPTNTPCAASPVTDGELIIANFGSAGVFAYDFEGRKVWSVDLGLIDHQWGYAASPVLDTKRCYVHFGPGKNHFLAALDKRTGKELWRKNIPREHPSDRTDGFAGRQGEIGSWSTPILVSTSARTELVVSLPGKLAAFDPSDGKELWHCDGLNPLLYTSAVAGEGMVIGSGGYGGSTVAVPSGGAGDMSAKRLWHKLRDKQRIGSGVIHNGYFYILNTPGTAQCIDMKNGEPVWEQRLQGPNARSESWASMVLSGERIYVNNQAGDVFILKASPQFELLVTNSISDGVMNASICVSNGELFLRTENHLWCIR